VAGGGVVELYVDSSGEESCFWEFGGVGLEYLFGLGTELDGGCLFSYVDDS